MTRGLDRAEFLTDRQIAERLAMPYESWLASAKKLERQGLPKRDPDVGHRRYWPAVRAYLDRRAGLDAPSSPAAAHPELEENWS